MDKKIKVVISSVLALLLASCSHMPDWLGSSEKEIDHSGKRIAVLSVGTTIEPDLNMAGVPVVIPAAKPNSEWLASSGNQSFVHENISAPKNFVIKESVSFGKGVGSDQHLSATPIVANGKIYTIDSKGLVSAFDSEKINKRLWQYQIKLPNEKGNFSNAGILLHAGKIYVSTGSNMVVAIDAEEGKLAWTRNINSIARSAPAAEGNIVVVNTADNKLYALDSNDGGVLWVHSGAAEEMSVAGSAAPVIANGVVFVPYSSGELYALKLTDGGEIWSDTLTAASGNNGTYLFADIDASPLVVGSSIYAISDDGVLVASETATGKRLWEHSVSGSKTPWFASGFLYILNDNSEIICLKAATGGIKWVKKLPAYRNEAKKSDPIEWNGPVLAGDMLLLAGSSGQMLSLSPETGDIVSKTEVPKDVYVSPVVVNERIYLINDNAKLVELGN
jgi:outer membrane protein assembly factor BamB